MKYFWFDLGICETQIKQIKRLSIGCECEKNKMFDIDDMNDFKQMLKLFNLKFDKNEQICRDNNRKNGTGNIYEKNYNNLYKFLLSI